MAERSCCLCKREIPEGSGDAARIGSGERWACAACHLIISTVERMGFRKDIQEIKEQLAALQSELRKLPPKISKIEKKLLSR